MRYTVVYMENSIFHTDQSYDVLEEAQARCNELIAQGKDAWIEVKYRL